MDNAIKHKETWYSPHPEVSHVTHNMLSSPLDFQNDPPARQSTSHHTLVDLIC